MSEKLELGSRVCKLDQSLQKYNPEEDTLLRGTIEGTSRREGKVFVKWDSNWRKPNPEEVDLASLISEEDAEKRTSALEVEYNKWSMEVRDKCQQAAQLIREAGKIADLHGFSLGETYDLNHGIQGAMGEAGWNTSSWGC